VFLNGTKLVPTTDFTATSGTEIVLGTAASSGSNICIVGYGTFSLANFSVGDANDVDLSGISNGDALLYNSTSGNFEAGPVDALPSQSGNSGKYLTTDGSTASWGTVDLSSKVAKSGDTMTGELTVAKTSDGGITIDNVNASGGRPRLTLKDNQTSGATFQIVSGWDNPADFDIIHSGVASRFRIDGGGRVTMPYQPAFYTKVEIPSGSPGDVRGKGTPITNTGSHFNGASGRFTAPIAGRYYFALDLSPGNNTTQSNYFYFYFQKNGSDISDYHLSMSETVGNNSYDNIGGSMILDLSAGDFVGARFAHHGSWNGDIAYGNFCGYLIG
jgi:hypothetical protein